MNNKIKNYRNREIFEKGKAFVGYFLFGYPNKQEFYKTISDLESTNLNIIEIGIPSNDPYFDGEIIRNAHKSIVEEKFLIEDYIKLREYWDGPIWIMGYKSDLIESGLYKQLIVENIADALVIPELSLFEKIDLNNQLRNVDVDILSFCNPDMTEKEITESVKDFGIIYGQLYNGKTGQNKKYENLDEMINVAHKNDSFICAGFGIDSVEKLNNLNEKGFDGFIIGSEILKRYNENPESAYDFLRWNYEL